MYAHIGIVQRLKGINACIGNCILKMVWVSYSVHSVTFVAKEMFIINC